MVGTVAKYRGNVNIIRFKEEIFAVFPQPLYDNVGLRDEEDNEDDLKTPTIENVLALNEVSLHRKLSDDL